MLQSSQMPPRKALQTIQQEIQINWQEVFNAFDGADALLKAKAAHRTACGMTNSKIASELGVSIATLKAWREEDSFNKAVEIIRSNFGQYIQSGLNHKLVLADEFMDWILAIDPLDEAIPKELKKDILREKGLAARSVYENAMPKKSSDERPVHVTVPVFNVTPETAQILVGRLKVIDGKESD